MAADNTEADADVLSDIKGSSIKRTNTKYEERRRIRTMNSKTLPSQSIYSYLFGRASASASGKRSGKRGKTGSITVEAAMAVPLFFLAVVCLMYLMEIMAVQTAMRSGLQYAGKKAAEEAYMVRMVIPSRLEQDVVQAIGADRLERSIVVGGSSGVQCDGSRISSRTGIGELVVTYKVRLPIPLFGVPPLTYQEKMRIKAWVGYEKPGLGMDRDETVYITETGVVYHKDYHCTYLDLSIHMVPPDQISGLRNKSGGKYYPCEHCMRYGGAGVYITDTGSRYHNSTSCSGLKRTVYAVSLSEVIGKGACSKCGQ